MFGFLRKCKLWWRRFTNVNVRRGRLGEKTAVKFFKIAGYKIVDKNWRSGRYELDIVVYKQGCFAFVEVRGRSTLQLRSGYDTVDKHKRSAIKIAIEAYLKAHRYIRVYRFDVVSIAWDEHGKIVQLNHYENVTLK